MGKMKKLWCDVFGHKQPLHRTGVDELEIPYPPFCTRCWRFVHDDPEFIKADAEFKVALYAACMRK